MKKQGSNAKSSTNADLHLENIRAQRRLDELKRHLADDQSSSTGAARRAGRDDYISAPFVKVRMDGRSQSRRPLQKFPEVTNTTPSSHKSTSKQKGGDAMPKKVKLTYLKANEPLELPKRDLNTVPLSQKLINAQRDDFMQPVAERPSKMNRISSTTASTSMPADLMCGQCECAKACKNCTDCKEIYCSTCFAQFHQKGALKNHVAEPLQPVSSNNQFQHVDARNSSGEDTRTKSLPTNGSMQLTDRLIEGTYDEAAQAQSFQDALRAWRESRRSDAKPQAAAAPVTVSTSCAASAMGSQTSTSQKTVHSASTAAVASNGTSGGALWGEYDEEAGSADFARALQEWRADRQGASGKDRSQAGSTVAPIGKTSASTSAGTAPLAPKKQPEFSFGPGALSYTERLMLQKYREGKLPHLGLQTFVPPVQSYVVLHGSDLPASLKPEDTSADQSQNPYPQSILTSSHSALQVDQDPLPEMNIPASPSLVVEICEDEAVNDHDEQSVPVLAAEPSYTGLGDFFLAGVERKSENEEVMEDPEVTESTFAEPVMLTIGVRYAWQPTSSLYDPVPTAEADTCTSDDEKERLDSQRPVDAERPDTAEVSDVDPRPQPVSSPQCTGTCQDSEQLIQEHKLEFEPGDLQVLDVDGDEAEEGDEEEMCLTELARELATAHGFHEAKNEDLVLDITPTELASQLKEMELGAFGEDLQQSLNAGLDELRDELDASDDPR